MGFLFKPAIYKNSILYELPRPVTRLRIQDSWDFTRYKIPLVDGDYQVGHSLQGVDISLKGQVGSQSGNLKLTEQEMFEAVELLRSNLDVSSEGEKYDLFLYHDSVSFTYRQLKSCSTVRFEYDLSDKNLFVYSAIIHATDPVIYSTSPGS
jgi:hypothetical protein